MPLSLSTCCSPSRASSAGCCGISDTPDVKKRSGVENWYDAGE